MSVNVQVNSGSTATVAGPALLNIKSDRPGSVLIDGAPVNPLPPVAVAPVLSSIAPTTAVAGSPDVTLTATGTGFTPTTILQVAGVDQLTNYVDATHVACTLDVSAAAAGTVQVTARNADKVSGTKPFVFT